MQKINAILFVFAILLSNVNLTCLAQEEEIKDTITAGPGFGGPGSVAGQIKRELKLQTTIVQPYFEFKTSIIKKSGFAYSFDYFPMVQVAAVNTDSNFQALGTFRASFYYALAGRKSGNIGALVFQTENRHSYTGNNNPLGLGQPIGYIGQPGEACYEKPWALNNLYWEQNFFDYKFTFLAGILDATDYLNSYALVDPYNDFLNLAFSNDLSIAFPDPGLGLAVFGMLSKKFYLMGGLFDANGNPYAPLDNFESFFSESEYFISIEFGWVKFLENPFSDNIHITYWYADERKSENIPSGWGLAFSYNQMMAKKWEPFLRLGVSQDGGAIWEKSLSIGCGYHISEIVNMLGFGLNLSQPSQSTFGVHLDNQFTSEVYCRFKLWKIFTLTPDFQLVINPALNHKPTTIAVFGLRAQVSI